MKLWSYFLAFPPVNKITQTATESTTSRSRYYQEPQSCDPVLMTLITCTASTFLHFHYIFKNTSTFKSDDIPECQLRVKDLPSSSRLLMGLSVATNADIWLFLYNELAKGLCL